MPTRSGNQSEGDFHAPVALPPTEVRLPFRGEQTIELEYSDEGSFSVRDGLRIVLSHKLLILFVFALVNAGAVAFLMRMPATYQSEAKLYLRGDLHELSVDPTGTGETLLREQPLTSHRIERTEMSIIASTNLAEMVVERVGPETISGEGAKQETVLADWLQASEELIRKWFKTGEEMDDPRLRAAQELMKNLTVEETMNGSRVLKVTYRAGDPQTARMVLMAFLNEYLNKREQLHRNHLEPEFFAEESEKTYQQLTEEENRLEALRRQWDIPSFASQRDSLIGQISSLQAQILQSQASIKGMKVQAESVEQLLKDQEAKDRNEPASSTIRNNGVRQSLEAQLVQLQLERRQLAQDFTDQAPQMKDINQRIQGVEQMLAALKEQPAAPTAVTPSGTISYQSLESVRIAMKAEEARLGALQTERASLQEDLERLIEHETEFTRIERSVSLLEGEYHQYMKSLHATEIAAAMGKVNQNQVAVLQSPTLPIESSKEPMRALLILFFGLVGSVMLGVGAAVGAELMDHSFKTSEDVERYLGLPVLVTLPRERFHRIYLPKTPLRKV